MWIAIVSSAITAVATLAATAVGWSLHQRGKKTEARRELYEEILLSLTYFDPDAPDPDRLSKLLRHFVQIDLLEKGEVRTLFMLIFDSIGECIIGKKEFDTATFTARLNLLALFMRAEVNGKNIDDDGGKGALEYWRLMKGLDASPNNYAAAAIAIIGYKGDNPFSEVGSKNLSE
jgi:hypothetical protein